jgi:hypothetical protein
MVIKTLTKENSEELLQFLASNGEKIPDSYFQTLDSEYQRMRSDLLAFEQASKQLASDDYGFDLEMASQIYEYFNSLDFFNETVASNYGFWRYVCVKVVPDLTYRRHGYVPAYFYEKSVRLYIPTLWWYFHMSWQGTADETKKILRSLNTDYIMQLVERPGREGTYLGTTRAIMKYLGKLPPAVTSKKVGNSILFRRVMIQNTAKNENYNLAIDGKTDQYVKDLFESCGVEVEQYE